MPDLTLSFEPDAIRDHFEDDPEFADKIDTLNDETLHRIGLAALTSETVYRAYHIALATALEETTATTG